MIRASLILTFHATRDCLLIVTSRSEQKKKTQLKNYLKDHLEMLFLSYFPSQTQHHSILSIVKRNILARHKISLRNISTAKFHIFF